MIAWFGGMFGLVLMIALVATDGAALVLLLRLWAYFLVAFMLCILVMPLLGVFYMLFG